MLAASTKPRTWIGHCLVGIAALHTLFAVVVFGKVLLKIAERGLFNSVGTDPLIGAAVWFVLFGFGLALFGMAVIPLERGGQRAALRQLGVGLLLLCALGIVLMPASGFWLAIVPALAMLRQRAPAALRMASV